MKLYLDLKYFIAYPIVNLLAIAHASTVCLELGR